MKKALIILLFLTLSGNNIFCQKQILGDLKISDSTSSDYYYGAQIAHNEKGDIYVVYKSQNSLFYDYFDNNLNRIVYNKLIQNNVDAKFNYSIIRPGHNADFSLFWYYDDNTQRHLYCRRFNIFGIPLTEKKLLTNVEDRLFYVSDQLNNKNQYGVIYRNDSAIFLRYFSVDETDKSEKKQLLNLKGTSNYFYYTANFLPDNKIIINYVDRSYDVKSLIFSEDGTLLSDTIKTVSPINAYKINEIISANSEDNMAVVWRQYDENDKLKLFYQRFDLNGNRLGETISVYDENRSSAKYYGQVSIDFNQDNLVVVWTDSVDINNSDFIYFQIIDRYGNKIGKNNRATKINNNLGDKNRNAWQFNPKVVFCRDQIYIVWDNYNPEQDLSPSIYLTVLAENQENLPPDFLINHDSINVYAGDSIKYSFKDCYDPNNDEITFQVIQNNNDLLPAWLQFESKNRILKGLPGQSDVGNYDIKVLAKDPFQAADTLLITIIVNFKPYTFNYNGPNYDIQSLMDLGQFDFTLNDTTLCSGDSLLLNDLIAFQNREILTNIWYAEDELLYDNIYRLTVTKEIKLKATDEWQCEVTKISTINVLESPQVSINSADTLCFQNGMVLSGELGGNYNFKWSTGSGSLSVNINKPGIYILEATNEYGCTNSDTVIIESCTGVSALGEQSDFLIYPNPVDKILKVQINFGIKPPLHISIIDIKGQTIMQKTYPVEYIEEILLDVSSLSRGVYQLIINNNEGFLIKRMFLAY